MLLNITDLPPYAVMSFVGGLVTLAFMWRRFPSFHITYGRFIKLFLLCAITCFWGSKLLYLLVLYFMEEASWVDIPRLFMASGYVFYGGLFGALFGVWLYVRLTKGLCLQEMLQMTAPALPLFHGFGRIGCALAGCCYGMTLSTGIVFPNGYELYRFPTQITEAVFEFALFGLLCFWEKRKKQVDLLKTYLLSYGVFRFFLEFYRADVYRGEWLGFSTSQWISLMIIIYYAARLGRRYSMKRYVSLLLALLLLVLGMAGGRTATAAAITETVVPSEIDASITKDREFIKMTVELENVDVNTYAQYTAELHKLDKFKKKTIVFAKAAPGTQIKFTIAPGYPDFSLSYTSALRFYEPENKKIEGNWLGLNKENKDLYSGGSDDFSTETWERHRNLATRSYTMPNDVEAIRVDCVVYYTIDRKQVDVYRRYYIFPSDEAFKKGYELMTGKSIWGSIDATAKPNMQNNENDGTQQPLEGAHEDLPESDAGKAAAAVGTSLLGTLLGLFGAIGGGPGGGAAGAAGTAAGNGYVPEGGPPGPYGVPDNMAFGEDGSIQITAPTGEKLIYTRNEDGSYNLPTRTETGEALTYQDENGNWHTAEPMTLSQEEVMEGARWYKEHEQELVADRAAEDARQQAERERLARENAAWLEREHAINNQRSLYGLEVQKELKMMEQQQAKEMYMDKLHWKYDPVGKDLSDEELKTVVKREQIKNNIKGGLYEQEAAKWDNHLITAQEIKFGADQAVNAYGILTHNQAFATAYSACTNYSETMVDAKLNNKDTGKAFLKATIDTGLDALANKFESHGWHITGNAFSGAYKQVNDNVYNGRDAWDNTDTAAVYGGVMGTVSKGIAKLGELSQGTVLGKNIGGSSPDVDMNLSKPKPDMDVDTKGIRPTTIAERRLGQGQIHTNTPMSDADVKMSINEDVQAIRSMNDVRQLNKISTRMDTIEKANPRTYQNNAEYQKLSQQFETQRAKVSEDMVAVDRMNAIQGDTGTNLRQRYNQSAMAYENKVLQHRNESIVESTGLKPSQIGDFHASSNKDAIRAAGGPAAHDLDTSPNVKVETGTGKNKSVDFSQTDGDHHLVRGIYKAEHGRYPQTAAEYAEGQQLAQNRHFTNVSTQPSNTHEIKHNPEAYVGSGKGEVNKVLQPDKYGTPDKGTGALNEQTAIHKQRAPLEQHRQQYAEAQDLRNQLNTDKSLSAAEKTEMGQKIATLERQSASNHYEATRTTAKENGVIKGINDANEAKGLEGGMSDDAKYIGEQAQLVREGKQSMADYKQIVTEKYGSEEKAQEILARGFRDTNK